MKKILYIVDHMLDQYNSVRDILYNMINHEEMAQYDQIIAKSSGKMYNPIKIDYCEGIKEYSTPRQKTATILKSKDLSVFEKITYCSHKFLKLVFQKIKLERLFDIIENKKFLKTIIKKEKPQLVVFLISSPIKKRVDICLKYKIPYIFVLYDTYIGRPGINKEEAYQTEKFTIEHSEGYFVPDFFYELYSKNYDTTKTFSMKLPLLIEQDKVSEAYINTDKNYDFTYFGNIQSFRNGDEVKQLLKKLNITLDVFSVENFKSDDVFRIHPAVTSEELYSIIAGSKFLVAMDNSVPFQDYLPSKAYLYVSFSKPIVIFGDNKKSALIDFLKDYPWFYYQNINESTEGLLQFLNKDFPKSFDISGYLKYSEYLPSVALEPFVERIKDILK